MTSRGKMLAQLAIKQSSEREKPTSRTKGKLKLNLSLKHVILPIVVRLNLLYSY